MSLGKLKLNTEAVKQKALEREQPAVVSVEEPPKTPAPRSAPAITKFTRLEALGCAPWIKEQFTAGRSLNKITEAIFKDYPSDFEQLGTTAAQLERWLGDWRRKIAKTELLPVRLPGVIEAAETHVAESLNEMDEMQELYDIQKHRIEIDYGTERKINKLFKSTGTEVTVALNILKARSDLKADLGLTKRGAGQDEASRILLTDFAPRYGKVDVNSVISNPERRRRLLNAMEMVLSADTVPTLPPAETPEAEATAAQAG